MKQSALHLHSPRLTLALCALAMPVLDEDDVPTPTALNDPKADPPDAKVIRAGRRLLIPRHRPPKTQPISEHGLIVGHTRHTEVGGPQRDRDHRKIALN